MPLTILRSRETRAAVGEGQLRVISTYALALLAAVSMFDFGLPDQRPSRPIGVAAAGVCLLALGIEGRRRRMTSAHLLATVVVGIVCLSSTWSKAPEANTAAFSAIQLLVLFMLAFEFLDNRAAWNRIAGGLAVGGGALTLLVLRQFLSGVTVNGGRYTGFSKGDPNDVAWGIAIGTTLLIHFAFETRSARLRWGLGALAALGVPATVLTGSRSGVLVLIVGLVIVPWRLAWAGPRSRARFSFLLIVGLLGVAAMIPSDADFRGVDRVLAGKGGEGEGSVVERTELLKESFNIIGAHPIKGVGVAGGENAMLERLGIPLAVHNSFASVAVQAGLIAAGAWLLLWFVLVRTSWRAHGALRPIATALTLLTLAELMVRHAEYQKPLWLIAALAMSTSFAPGPGSLPHGEIRRASLALPNE
ncbi:MAG: O-antigen ligase family protein [Acidimicrobiales bacterium]